MKMDKPAPRPHPKDRVVVLNFHAKTGVIRQKVECKREDMHRHHHVFPGHDFLEITGQDVDVNDHMVDVSDPKAPKIVPRIYTLEEAKTRAALALDQEFHAAVNQSWAGVAHSEAADPVAEHRQNMKSFRQQLAAKSAAIAAAATAGAAVAVIW